MIPIGASRVSVAGDFVTAAAARVAVISLNGQLSPCVGLVLVIVAPLSFRRPSSGHGSGLPRPTFCRLLWQEPCRYSFIGCCLLLSVPSILYDLYERLK